MTPDLCVASPLLRSPYLDISVSVQTGKGTIFNIISGKRYEVGPAVIDLLNAFQQPMAADTLPSQMNLAPDALADTVAFLERNGLLLNPSQDGWATFTTDVIAVKNRLFGVEPYHSRANVVLMGVPFGKGNGKSGGGAEFPFQIREFSQKNSLDFVEKNIPMFDNSTNTRLKKVFQAGRVVDWGNLMVSANESTSFVYAKMEQVAQQLFAARQTPGFIGGDHSISYPLIKAATRTYPNLHVIHFDAHTDTYVSRYDAVEHWGKVHHYGNFMTHCLSLEGVNNVYQFGIRGFANSGVKPRAKQHINWCETVREQLQQGLPFDLPTGVPYYVTFDVDVLNPTLLPGTATPVAGGFSLDEIRLLFEQLLAGKQLIGFDVVEANPDFDRTDLTTQVTTEIILRLMSYLTINE